LIYHQKIRKFLVCFSKISKCPIILIIFLLKLEDGRNHYLVPIEFLEKISRQNKVLYKNQLKQEKKLDELKQVLLKIQKEDNLSPAFFEVNVRFLICSVYKLGNNWISF